MECLREFKKLEGQSWSVWKNVVEKLHLPGKAEEKETMGRSSKHDCYTKLPRSDMPLYGLTPKTELFELVQCNFCGYKYKLSAFADHIRKRHSSDTPSSPMPCSTSHIIFKNDKSLIRKRKSKNMREKALPPKEKEPTDNIQIIPPAKIIENVIKSDRHPLPKLDDNSSCLPSMIDLESESSASRNTGGKEIKTGKLNNFDVKVGNKMETHGNFSAPKLSVFHTITNIQNISPQEKPDCSLFQQVVGIRPPSSDPVLKLFSATLSEEVSVVKDIENQNSQSIAPPTPSHFSSEQSKSVLSSLAVATDNVKTEGGSSEKSKRAPITGVIPSFSSSTNRSKPSSYILSKFNNKYQRYSGFTFLDSKRSSSTGKDSKENFVKKQLRNARFIRECQRNSGGAYNTISKTERPSWPKPATNKTEADPIWHPGFRRCGGLLFANQNLPRFNTPTRTQVLRTEEQPSNLSQILQLNTQSKGSNDIDLTGNALTKLTNKRTSQFENGPSNKKETVTTLKKKDKVAIPRNSLKTNSQSTKLFSSQSFNSSKPPPANCKRSNNSSLKGEGPKKLKKPDNVINIVGSVFTNNEHKLPVMHVELPNSVFENHIIPPAPLAASSNTIDLSCSGSVPTGVEVLNGNILPNGSIQIEAPQIHYYTSSSSLPTVANTGIQEFQLKTVTLQPQYQVISPQINISPTGGVYIIKNTLKNRINGIVKK